MKYILLLFRSYAYIVRKIIEVKYTNKKCIRYVYSHRIFLAINSKSLHMLNACNLKLIRLSKKFYLRLYVSK